MLKLNQFRIEGTIPSTDTTTYRAIDRATGSSLMLHFLPHADEPRFQLHARLQSYVETCRAKGVPVRLSIEQAEGFVASALIEDFRSLGEWLDAEIASMRGVEPQQQQTPLEERTLDVTWLRFAEAQYDRPVSTASEFGFVTLPPKPAEPLPEPEPLPDPPPPPAPPPPEPPLPAGEVEALRMQLQQVRRVAWALGVALAVAVLALLAVTVGGSSR